MKIINKKQNQLTFSVETNESLANVIRRYVDQIPTLAIDEVEISKNDSPLYDETVAHRIGLVPLKMEKTAKEEEQLTLISKKDGVVYSEEIKGNVSPVYGKIPLTILKKGQELEILATARMGKGSTHSKFSPGFLFYRNSVKVKLDKDCPKEIVKTCPKGVFSESNGKVVIANEGNCDLCEECIEFCKKKGKNFVELVPSNELIVTVESFGQISEEEIFKKAIEVLKNDLKEFSKKINK